MLQILSVFVFVVLALEFNIQHINGLPHPSRNSMCNCIRAKDCIPFTTKMQNSGLDGILEIVEELRISGCGVDTFSEPMICCSSRIEAFDFTNHHSNSMKDRWVWKSRPPYLNDKKSDRDVMENKFLNNENQFIGMNLIDDYVDWKTQRNCPPILYKETNYRFQKKFQMQHIPNNDHDTHHHFDFDDHNYPHEFHHHTSFHNNFDEEDYDSNEHTILHSPSKHAFRPDNFPKKQEPLSRDRPETTPMTTTTSTTSTTSITTPTVNSLTCGVTLNKRIIGGIEALPGEFPWITRIAYLNRTDNSIAYRCTGSFISELHILTAAHCIANLDDSLNVSHIRLVDSNANNDCNNQNKPCQEPPNMFEIAETIVHPNYDNPRRSNDIAIIKIKRPSNIELNYGTICLPLSNSSNLKNNSLIGSTGIVAGWSNNEGTDTNDLQVRYLRLRILNNTDCADSYDTFRQGFAEKITIISSMVCTQGQTNGSDVCRGDSGGPLMDDGSSGLFVNREGRYTLLGIVAFGPICGLTNLLPGVYMRVSEYVDWITNNIR